MAVFLFWFGKYWKIRFQSISLQCPVNTVVIKNSNDLGGLYGTGKSGNLWCQYSKTAFVKGGRQGSFICEDP